MAEIREIDPQIVEKALQAAKQGVAGPQEVTAKGRTGRSYAGNRVPFLLATEDMLNQTPTEQIVLFCNPRECAWTFGQRSATQKIKSGTAWHLWPRVKAGNKTYWDEPVVNLTFQTGNVLPIRGAAGNPVPAGLSNLYGMLGLFEHDPHLPDGTTNWVYITYNTRIFPEITLVGRFNPEGISTTESADDPNQLVYTAPFTVATSFPYFGNPALLEQMFRNAVPPSTRREGEAEVLQRNQQRRESSFP